MDINIEEYLTEEEMKEIVIKKFKDSIIFNEENDIKRIISNTAYDLVYEKVDEMLGEDIETLLSKKIKTIIGSMTEFNIFKKPDVWDRETNGAYDFLMKCFDEERENIKEMVKESLPKETMKEVKINMNDIIKDSVIEFYYGLTTKD